MRAVEAAVPFDKPGVRSVQQITDHAVREQPPVAGQDQHAVLDDCQASRQKINKTTLLGTAEQ